MTLGEKLAIAGRQDLERRMHEQIRNFRLMTLCFLAYKQRVKNNEKPQKKKETD